MLGRQERIALLMLVGVAVVVCTAHGILSVLGKGAFAHSFTNQSADGELVFIEGCIDDAAATKTGNHITLHIRNVTVFIPSQAAQGLTFQKGQNISLFGTVDTYHGEKEIIVTSGNDIRFL